MTHPAYVLAALAERDRARATAVTLEQELAEVTRERDAALAELDRLRGNVNVLAEVTKGLPATLDDLLTDEERADLQAGLDSIAATRRRAAVEAAGLPMAGSADREVTGSLNAQFGPPRQEPQPRLPDPYGAPS